MPLERPELGGKLQDMLQSMSTEACPNPLDVITPRMLTNMRSGIPNWFHMKKEYLDKGELSPFEAMTSDPSLQFTGKEIVDYRCPEGIHPNRPSSPGFGEQTITIDKESGRLVLSGTREPGMMVGELKEQLDGIREDVSTARGEQKVKAETHSPMESARENVLRRRAVPQTQSDGVGGKGGII